MSPRVRRGMCHVEERDESSLELGKSLQARPLSTQGMHVGRGPMRTGGPEIKAEECVEHLAPESRLDLLEASLRAGKTCWHSASPVLCLLAWAGSAWCGMQCGTV